MGTAGTLQRLPSPCSVPSTASSAPALPGSTQHLRHCPPQLRAPVALLQRGRPAKPPRPVLLQRGGQAQERGHLCPGSGSADLPWGVLCPLWPCQPSSAHKHSLLQLPKPPRWVRLEKPVPMGSSQHGRDHLGDPRTLWSGGMAACPAGQPGGLLLALSLPTRGTG